MARSLARNTKLYATTLDISGEAGGDVLTSCDPENTFELKVLDGYSFSQDVATQEVGVNESDSSCTGSGLARGTLSFNTALNPVDVSFSTYVRPFTSIDDVAGSTNTFADCVERILWGSAMGTATAWTNMDPAEGSPLTHFVEVQNATNIKFGLGSSNANELLSLTLFFVLEQTTYKILDFNISTAEVDFSIDGIATINWSGQGSRVLEDENSHVFINTIGTWADGTDYRGVQSTTTDTFIRNKLSILEVTDAETASTAIINAGDGAGYVLATGVLTMTTDLSTTTDALILGGRVHNETLDEWATILTSDVSSDTVTISAADRTLVDGWTVTTTDDVLSIYGFSQFSNVAYCIPITGATLSLENNMTYLTPEELAIVNLPLAGFAGNRVTSGSFTAYLNTGAMGTGGLLQDMLAKIESSVSNNYHILFKMGGTGTPRVEFDMPHANLSVPTTNVEDLITTEISFSAKPWDSTAGSASFEDTNELTITYYDKA